MKTQPASWPSGSRSRSARNVNAALRAGVAQSSQWNQRGLFCVKQNMGEQRSAHVDTVAVRAVADRFDAAADELDRAARTPLGFDSLTAGRAHTADGDELRLQLHRVINELSAWARAAAEIGAGLRAGADRYVDTDRDAATGIN
jgi:hypothetical protein